MTCPNTTSSEDHPTCAITPDAENWEMSIQCTQKDGKRAHELCNSSSNVRFMDNTGKQSEVANCRVASFDKESKEIKLEGDGCYRKKAFECNNCIGQSTVTWTRNHGKAEISTLKMTDLKLGDREICDVTQAISSSDPPLHKRWHAFDNPDTTSANKQLYPTFDTCKQQCEKDKCSYFSFQGGVSVGTCDIFKRGAEDCTPVKGNPAPTYTIFKSMKASQ